jgi:hypothetical protein
METPGEPSAAAHASVGQLVGPPGCRPGPPAGMQVRVLPGVLAHLEGPADGRRRQPFRKRKAHTGMRVRSSLPPPWEGDAGVAWRPVAIRVVAHGHEVRLLHLPPGSVGPAGVDARLSIGRSRVRVPYGARNAVVAAGWQSGLSTRAARVRSPSTVRSGPHEVMAACRILSPVARVQVPVGVRRCSRGGTGRRPGFKSRCPSDVWVRLPPRAHHREHHRGHLGGYSRGGDRCPGLPCKQARWGSIPRRSTSRARRQSRARG